MISFYHLTHFRWFGGKADFDGFYAIWRVVFNGEINGLFVRVPEVLDLSKPAQRRRVKTRMNDQS